jgi:hypothetical protein
LVLLFGEAAQAAPIVTASRGDTLETVTEPVLENFQIVVYVPSGEELERIRLVLDDRTWNWGGFDLREDSIVDLYWGGDSGTVASRDIAMTSQLGFSRFSETIYKRYVLTFDLPLWKPGINAIQVEVDTDLTWRSRRLSFDLRMAEEFGRVYHPNDGGLYTGLFEPPGVPMWRADCTFVFCKDADGDGLLDLWENLAVEFLRPALLYDEDEELFEPLHADRDHVKVFARVTPVLRIQDPVTRAVDPDDVLILFKFAIAYSRDYGVDGLAPELAAFVFGKEYSHNGDVEKLTTIWSPTAEGIRMRRGWTNGHPCLGGSLCTDRHPRPHHFAPTDIDWWSNFPHMSIAVEEDKHGVWPSYWDCEEESAYDCGGGRTIRPAAFNAGELRGDLLGAGRPFLDRLDFASPTGPFGDLYENGVQVFPGEAVWADWDPDLYFCGGRSCEDGSPGFIGRYLELNAGTYDEFIFAGREDDPSQAIWLPNGFTASCGLGSELALILPALLWASRRRSRAWRNAPFRNSGFRKLKAFAGYFTHES